MCIYIPSVAKVFIYLVADRNFYFFQLATYFAQNSAGKVYHGLPLHLMVSLSLALVATPNRNSQIIIKITIELVPLHWN